MGRPTPLRQALRQHFYPVVENRGFAPDRSGQPFVTTYRRLHGDTLQVFDVQWDHREPRFVIDFGEAPAAGTWWSTKAVGPHIHAFANRISGSVAPAAGRPG